MQKHTLTALAAVILAGCASQPPEPFVNTYGYDSKAHSGTVSVTDKHYSSDKLTCAPKWREGEVYTPKGLLPMGRDTLKFAIEIKAPSESEGSYLLNSYTIAVPQDIGSRVFVKDYQNVKSYMLGTESHGLIQQGDHFSHPEGYFIRISEPSVKGWDFVSCIAIDHMYSLPSDLESSTNPPIYLDRVVIPFAMDQANQPVKVSFGSKIQHTAEIRVLPE